MKTQAHRLPRKNNSFGEKIGCLLMLIMLLSTVIFIHKGLPTLADSFLKAHGENSPAKENIAARKIP